MGHKRPSRSCFDRAHGKLVLRTIVSCCLACRSPASLGCLFGGHGPCAGAAGFTCARVRTTIGRPRPLPGYPHRTSLISGFCSSTPSLSLRLPPHPASRRRSCRRFAVPITIGPQRISTSSVNAMPGTQKSARPKARATIAEAGGGMGMPQLTVFISSLLSPGAAHRILWIAATFRSESAGVGRYLARGGPTQASAIDVLPTAGRHIFRDHHPSNSFAPDLPAHHCPLVQRHYALVGICYALVQSAGPNSAAWTFIQSTIDVSSGLPFAYFGLPMKAFSVNKSDGSRRRLTRAAT